MRSKVRYVGLDVHKETIVIAVADAGRGEARVWKTIPHDVKRLERELEQLSADGAQLELCYEAGPTGYTLQRRLTAAGYACQVVRRRWCRSGRGSGSRPIAAMRPSWPTSCDRAT